VLLGVYNCVRSRGEEAVGFFVDFLCPLGSLSTASAAVAPSPLGVWLCAYVFTAIDKKLRAQKNARRATATSAE
jgi:hypothetical protein